MPLSPRMHASNITIILKKKTVVNWKNDFKIWKNLSISV